MSRIRVEITNLETGEWQWLGLLNEELLTELTEYADKLNEKLEATQPLKGDNK